MKLRRADALDSKDPGTSTDIPRSEALGGDFSVPNVKSMVSTEEQVRTFLRTVGDHQACEIKSEEHGCMAFESVVQVWRRFVIRHFHHYYSALCYFLSF